MKMSDVFTLPIAQNQSRHFKHVVYSEESDGVVFSCHSDQIAKYACHAINNHDRLTEENAKLRKMLTQLQIEGGLGIARHRQIDRLLNQLKEQTNDK